MVLHWRKYLLRFEPLPMRQRLVAVSLLLSCLLLGLTFFFIIGRLLSISSGRELIALHYNVYVGVDRVGTWSSSLKMPIMGLVVLIVNTLCASWVWRKERMLSTFFLLGTVLVEFVLATASLLVVLVNI